MAGENVLDYESYRFKEERETKTAQIKAKLKEGVSNIWNWIKDNKEMLCIIVPSVCGVTTTIVKTVGKHVNLKKEEQNKEFYCYDRSLGHYWKLRRELTNDEWVTVDRRKRDGERLGDILDEMKVLK